MSREKERLLRVNVAAQRLGRSERQVRRYVREGKLDCFRESERKTFIPEGAVEAFRERSEKS